jgi:hypothetical protein
MNRIIWAAIFPIWIFLFPQLIFGKNLHLIDQLPNGFKIYRSGSPSENDLREFHDLGIDEIAVLSGDAKRREYRYSHLVPGLKVVFNEKQNSRIRLTASFLVWFDNWVTDARNNGKVIAFRCRCGCHRTGRLAAYYQMKYQKVSVDEAIISMNKYGRNMYLHPELKPQVRALADYIFDRPCSQEEKYCVENDLTRETEGTVPP